MQLDDLFPREISSTIGWMFCVAIPEAERVLRRYGDPPGLFMRLWPTPILRGRPKRLLRAHYVELCLRWKRGEDLGPGTCAEVLCGLSEASLRAPLNQVGAALATRLARALVGFRHVTGRGSYPGEIRELLIECRRKMSQPWRKRKGKG